MYDVSDANIRIMAVAVSTLSLHRSGFIYTTSIHNILYCRFKKKVSEPRKKRKNHWP